MLGRLVLFLLHIVGGWFGSKAIMGWVGGSIPGSLRLFVFAVVAAIVVFLIGVIAAQVLKDVGQPGSPTLSRALVLALIAAVLWTFGPELPLLKEIPWGKVPAEYAVLAGAILGYWMRK
jgi:predicted acyltransferase